MNLAVLLAFALKTQHYYMKKDNEDIFIIEYQDSIAKQDKDE